MTRIAVAAAVCALIAPASVAAQVPSLTPAVSHGRSPAALYERACANCHGPDGRGSSRALATFSDPLPTSRTARSPRANPMPTGSR